MEEERLGRDSLIESRLFYPLVVLLMFFVVLIIKTAWVGDDAFISFRPLDNLLHGINLDSLGDVPA